MIHNTIQFIPKNDFRYDSNFQKNGCRDLLLECAVIGAYQED